MNIDPKLLEKLMKWKQSIDKFTYGWYGIDQLSKDMMKTGLACLILSLFPYIKIVFYPLGTLLFVLSVIRCMSKNHSKRMQENQKYMQIIAPVKKWFSIQKRRYTERNDYKYFKCPQCKTYNRIPRGRGKIMITCPKCKNQFERKS